MRGIRRVSGGTHESVPCEHIGLVEDPQLITEVDGRGKGSVEYEIIRGDEELVGAVAYVRLVWQGVR